MAPPQFSKIGTKVKDLFSKKYDFHNSMQVTQKGDDLTIEAGGNDKSGDFAGNVVAKYQGHELTLNTASGAKVKAKVGGLPKGVDATFSTDLSSSVSPTLEVNHKTGDTACNLKFKSNGEKHNLSASACYGLGDVTVGVSGATKDFGSLSDCDAGLEYSTDSMIVAATSKNFFNNVGLSWYSKWGSSINWGASITVLPEVSDLTVGADYAFDKSTTLKAKADTNGSAAFAIEHQVKESNFKLNLASEFDTNTHKSTNFGVGLSFGDY